jgi:hypothetical protein
MLNMVIWFYPSSSVQKNNSDKNTFSVQKNKSDKNTFIAFILLNTGRWIESRNQITKYL